MPIDETGALTCAYCNEKATFGFMRQCTNCGGGKGQPPQYFHYACQESGCETLECFQHVTCWKIHLPDNPRMKRVHRAIDPLAEIYVKAATFSEPNASEQARLHQQDKKNQWFMIHYNTQDWEKNLQPWISVTDRFRRLCDPQNAGNRFGMTQYPSFVSFIGDTGVGKSTLLRAMMMMGQLRASTRASEDENEIFKKLLKAKNNGPVTRSANTEELTDPTSSGVHLYKDITVSRPDPGQLQPQTRSPGSSSSRANSDEVRSAAMSQPGSARTDEAYLSQTHYNFVRAQTNGSVHVQGPISGQQGGQANADTATLASQKPDAQYPDADEGLLANLPYTSTPMLFADCEGFRGSITPTNSERAIANETSLAGGMYNLIEKPITAPGIRQKQGKEGAEIFYARFLYAISDVLVFVTKSDQMLHGDLQRLMEWAASAINNSVNNAVHKTLIVVRNMPELHNPIFYKSDELENSLFRGLRPLWEGSPLLQTFINQHNATSGYPSQHITTNKDLFDRFFKSHSACYIPSISKASDEDVYDQYSSLRKQIDLASERSQELRQKSWTQYNVPTLTHLLGRAFEHYRTSDRPFDFFTASRKDNPNPTSPADHIANFLSRTYGWRDSQIFFFSSLVSLALVGYVLRNFFEGGVSHPTQYFARTLKDFCQQSLVLFEHKYQKCAFKFDSKGAEHHECIVKRPMHVEHCSRSGVRQSGEFVDEMIKVRGAVVDAIQNRFIESFYAICGPDPKFLPSAKDAARRREEILSKFAGNWQDIQSNRTCFTCLFQIPDHVLPCGHSLCSSCVVEFGQPSKTFEACFKLSRCPLCQVSWNHNMPTFHLKPPCAGVRVLTLDGGGIRGVVELALLEQVADRLKSFGLDGPIRELFDMIMGTSTGGIISLGLALRGDKSVRQMKKTFLELAEDTFKASSARKIVNLIDHRNWVPMALLILRFRKSMYRTKPLKKGLQDLFTKDRLLFSGGPEEYYRPRITRVAVTSAKDEAATACLITNYNRPQVSVQAPVGSPAWRGEIARWNSGYNDGDFEREDREENEMRAWEAALATSAAPFYFKPFVKEETSKEYVDGALHANLPISYALSEIRNVWPELGAQGAPPDVLLSLGTGEQSSQLGIPDMLDIGGLKKLCKAYHQSLDTAKMWREFCEANAKDRRLLERIHRLNAKLEPPYVALDKHERMNELAASVEQQMHQPGSPLAAAVAHAADALVASLFFFEPLSPTEPGEPIERMPTEPKPSFRLRGTIRCRLARGSTAVKKLVDHVVCFAHKEVATTGTPSAADDAGTEDEASHLVSGGDSGNGAGTNPNEGWEPIFIDDSLRHAVKSRDEWLHVPVKVAAHEEESTRQVLGVVLKGREDRGPLPISGFPASLAELRGRMGVSR